MSAIVGQIGVSMRSTQKQTWRDRVFTRALAKSMVYAVALVAGMWMAPASWIVSGWWVAPEIQAADELDLLDKPQPTRKTEVKRGGDDLDDLLDKRGGTTALRWVSIEQPERVLSERLFWRLHQGAIAAETMPAEIRLGGQDVKIGRAHV